MDGDAIVRKKEEMENKSYELIKVLKPSPPFKTRPSKMELMFWYSESLDDANNLINLMEEIHDLIPTCEPGCWHCCRQPIFVSRFEAEMISHYISSLPNAKMLFRASTDFARVINRKGLSASRRASIGNSRFASEYFSSWLVCPFLSDNTCSIYGVRPLVCALYKNYGSAKDCASSSDVGTLHNHGPWIDWTRARIQSINTDWGVEYCDACQEPQQCPTLH